VWSIAKVGQVRAVDDVSFDIARGETLALVGESGCGKSTTGRLILRLIDPTGGSVRFKGEEIAGLDPRMRCAMRRHMQIIFQDPYASLNPRMTVGDILAEPMQVHGIGSQGRARGAGRELLEVVGLRPSMRAAIRISSPAASASASASPGRWRSIPS
jgi:oligopeptide transport system ATP-binding protein